MRSNYKKLGPYIREVNIRNKDLKVELLLGVSIKKVLMPSIANTVGTRMHTYKIIQKHQFAYGPVTSRNGDKISIALLKEHEEAIVSQAYTVFEVKDKNELDPEYLMMWFRRPEFDRYARYHSHGSARETFDWDSFCETELPIPSIEKQREIVAEYNTVQNRIQLNEQLIQKLEETAQTIYRRWFVEGIDLDDLPKEWRVGKLSDLIKIKYGKAYSHLEKGDIPLYGSGGLMSKVNKALYEKPSVLIPRKGTLSNIMFVNHPFWCVDTMFYSIFNNEVNGYYAYFILKQLDFDALNQGSAVPSMTTAFLNELDIVLPSKNVLSDFNEKLKIIIAHKEHIEKESRKLSELKEAFLLKMTKVEETV